MNIRQELIDNVANKVYDILNNNRETEAENLIYSDDMFLAKTNANFNLEELKGVLKKHSGDLSR